MKASNEQVREDVEAWKYITFYTRDWLTFDLRVSVREHAIALIVAISDLASSLNPDYFGITNRTLISRIMIKKKLQRLADSKNLSVPQMLI